MDKNIGMVVSIAALGLSIVGASISGAYWAGTLANAQANIERELAGVHKELDSFIKVRTDILNGLKANIANLEKEMDLIKTELARLDRRVDRRKDEIRRVTPGTSEPMP